MVSIQDGIADVRLCRPEKHNALDRAMFLGLRAAQEQLSSLPGLRVAILRGEGPSFCSGLDLGAASSGELDLQELTGRPHDEVANLAQSAAYGWRTLPVPVIAAIHGACFGGGLQIALGADFRLATPDARLSLMEIKLGLVPDMAITQTLSRLVREDLARELAYTGRIVTGDEAVQLGLLGRVAADPVAAGREMAATIAARSPDAIRAMKRLFEEGFGNGPEALRLETELVRGLLGTPNQLEAGLAAVSGREPSFTDPQ